MRLDVDAPAEYMDGIVADLASRRGEVDPRNRYSGHATARVPLSAMFGYALDLRARTLAQSSFAMSFECYRRCARPSDWSGGDGAFVMAPVKPAQPRPGSGIELPEPFEDDDPDS
jgi:translation elongation factor EF-G